MIRDPPGGCLMVPKYVCKSLVLVSRFPFPRPPGFHFFVCGI